MRTYTRKRFLVLAALGLLTAGCGSSTEPVTVPALPLPGVYDLTTSLTNVSWETPAPDPPDCPASTLYCRHSRNFNGGSLSGTVTIESAGYSGLLGGAFCDRFDTTSPGGCTRVSATAPITYSQLQTPMRLSNGTYFIWMGGKSATGNSVLMFPATTIARDSLSGTLSWSLVDGRSPPTHSGTFVLRRRQ
ncbi:MAG: hypothetical protein M3Z05_00535 [Gemmatimonadota bacterium]|nr:hypothetical protein [Gemmatimonadota bacterium]